MAKVPGCKACSLGGRESCSMHRFRLPPRPPSEDEKELMDREGMSIEEVRNLAVPMSSDETLHGDALEMHLESMWD